MTATTPAAVETTSGRLRGSNEDGIYVFRGIPYGLAHRFRAPRAVEPQVDLRDALEFGPAAPQMTAVRRAAALEAALGPAESLDGGRSEDCLVLNVWTPGLNDGGRRPVMVWIHGGGYYAGSGASRHTSGHALARGGDVVMVTLNHRLGVLGYLKLDHLLGDEYTAAGVAGMLDLILALEWVRDNAAIFGGDAANVTIFGCSGGGSKVSHLLAMPRASGLFHRAIVESGPGLRSLSPDSGAELTTRLLAALGLDPAQASQLLQVPAERLVQAQSMLIQPGAAMLGDLQIGPVLTPELLPQHPFEPRAAPTAADIPLIIGTNQDEMAFMLGLDPRLEDLDDAGAKAWVVRAFGQDAEGLFPVYRHEEPDRSAGDVLIRVLSDYMRTRSIRLAERKLAGGPAPVYMYLFCYPSPVAGGRLKACHSLEVPFAFDTCASAPITGDNPDRFELASVMSSAWTSFARSGDPGWDAYDTGRRATMVFDAASRVVDDPGGAERQAWADMQGTHETA